MAGLLAGTGHCSAVCNGLRSQTPQSQSIPREACICRISNSARCATVGSVGDEQRGFEVFLVKFDPSHPSSDVKTGKGSGFTRAAPMNRLGAKNNFLSVDPEKILEGLPVGATVRINMRAVNETGSGPFGGEMRAVIGYLDRG